MAKQQKTQKHTDGNVLEKYKGLLGDLDVAYQKKVTELSVDLKSKLDFAMKEDRDSLMGWIIHPIAKGEYEPRLATLVFGESKYTALANDWHAVTAMTGYKPESYSRFHGAKALEALDAKRSTQSAKVTGGLVGNATYLESQSGLGNMLRRWVEKEPPFADRQAGRQASTDAVRSEVEEIKGGGVKAVLESQLTQAKADKAAAVQAEDFAKANELKARIAELEADLTKFTEAKPDRKAELTAQIETAKADKAKAIESEDGDALKAAKAKIAELEAELAKLTTPVVKTPASVASSNDVPGLDEVVKATTDASAGKGLKRLYQRWDADEITDEQFVSDGKALMGMK